MVLKSVLVWHVTIFSSIIKPDIVIVKSMLNHQNMYKNMLNHKHMYVYLSVIITIYTL
jgi:hypothetical protein